MFLLFPVQLYNTGHKQYEMTGPTVTYMYIDVFTNIHGPAIGRGTNLT